MIFYNKFEFKILIWHIWNRILPMITFFNIIVLDDEKLKRKCSLTVIFGQG
jgi:hypothetical protein